MCILHIYRYIWFTFIFCLWKESTALTGIRTRDLRTEAVCLNRYANQQPQGIVPPKHTLNKTNTDYVLELGVNTRQLKFLHKNS